MTIDVLTLFPKMFDSPFEYSIVNRAKEKDLIIINTHDLRSWATDKYKSVDDRPYGGGPGMIMRVDLIDAAVNDIKETNKAKKIRVIVMDARGVKFTQKKAESLRKYDQIILIAGHYEGIDYRVLEHVADEVISIGNYVLSGGEIPAMVIIDTITRLLPGALGNSESLVEESHNSRASEYPQYTRPKSYKSWAVPEVLLSGDHKKISLYRKGDIG